MKRACLFLMLFALVGASNPTLLRAQISSSAFDPNCYQPRIGVPGEIDTIYGSYSGQQLGGNQFSPGPGPNGYNRVFFSGYPNNPNGWDIMAGGANFNLNDLDKPKSKFLLSGYGQALGHFHSRKFCDILHFASGFVRIYWADSSGDYDSSRRTILEYRMRPGPPNGAYKYNIFSPYIAHMTSDTVDDLILCCATSNDNNADSLFVLRYSGGATLYKPGDTVLNDDAAYFPYDHNRSYLNRNGGSGDLRSTGRSDYVATDLYGNVFHFKNDPPFDLSQFARAMYEDTLIASWQNPEVHSDSNGGGGRVTVLPILHRLGNNATADLDMSWVRSDDPNGNYSENIFAGGPNFGSKRLTAKDTTFCLRSPGYYDPMWFISWGGGLGLCGDMTGTGEPVISMDGGEPGYSHSFFYVMGEATDPLVDMYFGQAQGGGVGDTITADGDNLEDMIGGNPNYRTEGGKQTNVGTIEVLHGSRKIPVRLNPRFAVVPPSVQSGDSLRIAPNPCSNHTVVTWESSCSGSVGLQLYDVMGRQVFHERRPTTGALESFSLDLPRLPNGEYFLVLLQEPCVQRGRILVQE